MKKFLLALCALAFIGAVSQAQDSKPKETKMAGWVSDEKCAAGGAKAEHADCAKKCAEGGKALVVVNDKDQSVWTVKNPEVLKGHEGHHVKLSAQVLPDNALQVEKVSMMKDKASKAKGTEMTEHK